MTNLMIPAAGPAHCGNCDWKGEARECDIIVDIQDRLDAGATVPCGQCPACGMLAYLDPSPSEERRAKLRAALPAKRKAPKMPALFQWQKIKGGKGYRGVIDDARQLILSERAAGQWQVMLDNSATNAADYLCDLPSLEQAKAIGQLVASGLRAREHVPALLAALMRLRDCPDVQMDCTETETDEAREQANAVIAATRGWAL